MSEPNNKHDQIFDYRALRLLVGIIALVLPIAVKLISKSSLLSISASYYTEARNIFVGLLFMIGALMLGYNGKTGSEKWVSKLAAIAAMLVALFPTANGCESNWISWLHYGSAAVLFSVIAYFCFGPFRRDTKGKPGKRGVRAKLYLFSGVVIVACMAAIAIASLSMQCEEGRSLAITFYSEWVALWAFALAWIVSGKVLPPLVDENQRLKIF